MPTHPFASPNVESQVVRNQQGSVAILFALLFFLTALFTQGAPLYGQTYTGSDGGNWSVGSNWDTGMAPVSGSSNLTITYAGAGFISTTQDISGPFELQSFVLSNGASNFTINSTEMVRFNHLGAGPTIENQASNLSLIINSDVELADTLTINSTTGGSQIFKKMVSGSGGLTLQGSNGSTYLQGTTSKTFSGLTTVHESNLLALEKMNSTAIAGDLHLIGGTALIAGKRR